MQADGIYLDGSLHFLQTIADRIWLMNHLKNGKAYGGFMKEVVNRHIGMLEKEPPEEAEIRLKTFALTRWEGMLAAALGLCCRRNRCFP